MVHIWAASAAAGKSSKAGGHNWVGWLGTLFAASGFLGCRGHHTPYSAPVPRRPNDLDANLHARNALPCAGVPVGLYIVLLCLSSHMPIGMFPLPKGSIAACMRLHPLTIWPWLVWEAFAFNLL